MQTSEAGIAFIKSAEGYASVPYNDNGKMAWGYGHDQQPGENVPASISLDEADLLLRKDLASRYEPVVSKLVPANCTQSQFDALVDFCYNLGPANLETMLAHGWSEVQFQIPRWNHVAGVVSAGLSARRQAEVSMWNTEEA